MMPGGYPPPVKQPWRPFRGCADLAVGVVGVLFLIGVLMVVCGGYSDDPSGGAPSVTTLAPRTSDTRSIYPVSVSPNTWRVMRETPCGKWLERWDKTEARRAVRASWEEGFDWNTGDITVKHGRYPCPRVIGDVY